MNDNMILPIYIYGHPVLRKVAQDITPDYPDLKALTQNMWETLDNSNGVGLAAPQVGKSIRLVVIDLDVLKDDYPEYAGYRRVFINAHIIGADEEAGTETLEEGCLSIPGLAENVTRPKRVHVKYVDEEWKDHDEWVDGYAARVMQHEFDHLEGILYIDKISPLRKALVGGKLKNMMKGKFRASYRTKVYRK